AGLLRTENIKGKKGTQKVCHLAYHEMVIRFPSQQRTRSANAIEVEMPLGLYTNYEVSAPCGMCSTEGIIGFLDVPSSFLDPGRVKAGLLWFEKGFVEYKFANNSLYKEKPLRKVEISVELSSETPGTNRNWPSDISLWINDVYLGDWTSPGDFGDRRGTLTPLWWKLEGSQYGLLKNWSVTDEGSYVDGVLNSPVKLKDLAISEHHSIRVRFGVRENAEHPGGINIFGRGFGNYDQDIVLRFYF
ncbi:MAG TPA: transcriptional regulator, partial [Spirochaetia bacterium]|nr:transcriptional regulator [Spirochaetia bacterium]